MTAEDSPIQKPLHLPFLEAVCWDLADVNCLNLDEMLSRYERGWMYQGTLADLEGAERDFLYQLAKAKGSWLQLNV